MATETNISINQDRLWDSLMTMAKIGPGIAGGNNRQTLTDEDSDGRHLFKRWCEDQGCSMGLDKMGNMFARREGTDPKALPVYVGSHVRNGPNTHGVAFQLSFQAYAFSADSEFTTYGVL